MYSSPIPMYVCYVITGIVAQTFIGIIVSSDVPPEALQSRPGINHNQQHRLMRRIKPLVLIPLISSIVILFVITFHIHDNLEINKSESVYTRHINSIW